MQSYHLVTWLMEHDVTIMMRTVGFVSMANVRCVCPINRELETRDVFQQWTETESEHFACQDSGLSQIFKVIVSTSEKILNIIGKVVRRQVKWKPAHFRLPSLIKKSRELKLPNDSNLSALLAPNLGRD